MVDNKVRLHKFLADAGLCSRREAERWIIQGVVEVNGVVAKIGHKVDPSKDKISVRGAPIKKRRTGPVTLLMNKPKGFICSNEDPHHESTVFDLLPPKFEKERLFCAGRLDKDSEGLLILTNDGTLAQRLTHPKNRIIKRYRVWLNKPAENATIAALCRGIQVEGERLKADKIIPMGKGANPGKQYEVHLSHGRKREIRRMFEALGHRVRRLHRFQIGSFVLRGLGPGKIRVLVEKESKLLLG